MHLNQCHVALMVILLLVGCASTEQRIKAEVAQQRAIQEKMQKEQRDGNVARTKDRAYIASMQKPKASVPAEIADVLLVGKFSGACDAGDKFELQIFATLTEIDSDWKAWVYGQIVFPQSPPTYLAGYINLNSGLLYLETNRPPTREEFTELFLSRRLITGKLTGSDSAIAKIFGAPIPKTPTLVRKTFALSVARDSDGVGWAGGVSAADFPACREIKFARADGITTAVLTRVPLRDEESFRINAEDDFPDDFHRAGATVYWAKYWHSRTTSLDSGLMLARAYLVHREPALAVGQYKKLIERGDSRAQLELSRIYATGVGEVAKDEVESKRLLLSVSQQRAAATRICASKQFTQQASALVIQEQSDPKLMGIRLLGGVLTGLTMKSGKPIVRSVALKQMISHKGPFTCEIEVVEVGTEFESFAPEYVYLGRNADGDEIYKDTRLEAKLASVAASIGNANAGRPYVRALEVRSLESDQYSVRLVPNSRNTSSVYTGTISISLK